MKNNYCKVFEKVPGNIIHHAPAYTRNFIGCPSILRINKNKFLISHSYFGKGSKYSESFIYETKDAGRTWFFITNKSPFFKKKKSSKKYSC